MVTKIVPVRMLSVELAPILRQMIDLAGSKATLLITIPQRDWPYRTRLRRERPRQSDPAPRGSAVIRTLKGVIRWMTLPRLEIARIAEAWPKTARAG